MNDLKLYILYLSIAIYILIINFKIYILNKRTKYIIKIKIKTKNPGVARADPSLK